MSTRLDQTATAGAQQVVAQHNAMLSRATSTCTYLHDLAAQGGQETLHHDKYHNISSSFFFFSCEERVLFLTIIDSVCKRKYLVVPRARELVLSAASNSALAALTASRVD